jgi:hypothetical protein
VIRRLAARGELPASFHAPIPPSTRLAARDIASLLAEPGAALEPGAAAEPSADPAAPIDPAAVGLD